VGGEDTIGRSLHGHSAVLADAALSFTARGDSVRATPYVQGRRVH
jgi:hypothetical protein